MDDAEKRLAQQVAETLAALLDVMGNRPLTEIEEKVGWQRGYLRQVFSASQKPLRLRMEHVYGILLALDIQPAAFFARLEERAAARARAPELEAAEIEDLARMTPQIQEAVRLLVRKGVEAKLIELSEVQQVAPDFAPARSRRRRRRVTRRVQQDK